jgi:tetratricopeptide (TPR) repeat protein
MAQRQFASRFPKSSTQFVYYQIEIKNPWKYISVEYKLLARYYKPDGSVMGEIEDQIVTQPERETFRHTRGWGWEKAGNWPPGVYRVEVFIDSEYRITGEFTIFEDQAEKSFDSQPLPFFGSDALISEEFQRRFAPRLPKTLGRNQSKSAKGEEAMSEEEPKGLGFEGWLNRFSQLFPSDTQGGKIDPSQRLDDLAKMRWLMAIDRRYMATMPRTKPGFANAKVLQDLKEIAADYQKLLQAGLPQYTLYTAEGLRAKIADVFDSEAQLCETLRDYPQASQHYTAAAEIYTAVGKHEAAQRCQINLARLKLAQDGNINTEIKRLRAELARLPSGSVAHAATLIDLAELYSSNEEDYEAEKLLLEAEQMLDRIGGDPSGSDLGAALTQSLLSIMQGQHNSGPTPIETKMEVNGLYCRLSMALARIYETTNPQEAARYRAKATQRDSRAYNDEFSEYMRRALEGDLGKL